MTTVSLKEWILNNPVLRKQWKESKQGIDTFIKDNRAALERAVKDMRARGVDSPYSGSWG